MGSYFQWRRFPVIVVWKTMIRREANNLFLRNETPYPDTFCSIFAIYRYIDSSYLGRCLARLSINLNRKAWHAILLPDLGFEFALSFINAPVQQPNRNANQK